MRRLIPTLLLLAVAVTIASGATANSKPAPSPSVADTVIKMPLAKGVSAADAVEAMKIRANKLNIKLVAELPLSKQLEAMGEKSGRMEIYQFCDPLTAKRMVEHMLEFAAYLPCRIALVEDIKGRAWLVMLDLKPLIEGGGLPPALKADAQKVSDTLMEIMRAGAAGEW
jgi:uncharacterized protein (DUF302 family)